MIPTDVLDGMVEGAWIVLPVAMAILGAGLALGRPRRPVPIGGLVAIAATAAVLADLEVGIWSMLAGSALALVGGIAGRLVFSSLLARAAVLLPGMLVAITALEIDGPVALPILAAIVAALAGSAADEADEHFGRFGLTVSMMVISAVGVYIAIPETGLIGPIAGGLAPLALIGWPVGLIRLGPGGASAIIAILAALTVNGGTFRDGAIIGGLAAPALLVVLGSWSDLSRCGQGRSSLGRWSPTVVGLLVTHGLLVLAVTRVAGLRSSYVLASVLAALFLALGWLSARWILADADMLGRLRRPSTG